MNLHYIFLFVFFISCQQVKNKDIKNKSGIKINSASNMSMNKKKNDKYKIIYFKMFDFNLVGINEIKKACEGCWEFGYDKKTNDIRYIKEFYTNINCDTIHVRKYNNMYYTYQRFKQELCGPSTQIFFYDKNKITVFYYRLFPFEDKSNINIYQIAIFENNKIIFYDVDNLRGKYIRPLELINNVNDFIKRNCEESVIFTFYPQDNKNRIIVNKYIPAHNFNNIDTAEVNNDINKEFIYRSYLNN